MQQHLCEFFVININYRDLGFIISSMASEQMLCNAVQVTARFWLCCCYSNMSVPYMLSLWTA